MKNRQSWYEYRYLEYEYECEYSRRDAPAGEKAHTEKNEVRKNDLCICRTRLLTVDGREDTKSKTQRRNKNDKKVKRKRKYKRRTALIVRQNCTAAKRQKI